MPKASLVPTVVGVLRKREINIQLSKGEAGLNLPPPRDNDPMRKAGKEGGGFSFLNPPPILSAISSLMKLEH
jgi:hypothetical protein